jgi:glycosyltransferase involved in cell wall biosynthesis
MAKLKIAQIAPIWYPVPPKKYGGIERVVYYLTEGLKNLGHKVTLFSCGESKTSASLKFWRKNCLAKDKIPWSDYFLELEHFAFSFSNLKNFDIVHCHTGPKTFFFLNFVKIPAIFTFHNPIRIEKKTPLLEVAKRYKEKINAVFLSKAQREFCRFSFKKNFVVYNGVDENLFRFSKKANDYFLWVGRVEPYKGIENAILVAKKKKLKLFLVGKCDPEKKEYFKEKIAPNLNEKVRYLGEVSPKKLVKLYQGAIATLYPIEWPEPFGLIMAESMACGTPVIAFDFGSTKEVIKNGKTGFVVPFLNKRKEKNFEGLIEAVEKIKEIKREDCRWWVENNFTVKKMVKNYERVYFEIL